ncbi:MAG: hypothetical protein OSB10_07360, partial [Planctomycetota bacterium]|nr:hypothetical protein [Planctomycetota bacterium]
SLVCRARVRKPAVVFDAVGTEAVRREGPVDQQGADMLLLRPGGAAVEFDMLGLEPGEYELFLDVFALGDEPGVEHGGFVTLDGQLVGCLEPFCADGEDQTRRVVFPFELPELSDAERPRVLRVTSAVAPEGEGGVRAPEVFLRLQRVIVKSVSSAVGMVSA